MSELTVHLQNGNLVHLKDVNMTASDAKRLFNDYGDSGANDGMLTFGHGNGSAMLRISDISAAIWSSQ